MSRSVSASLALLRRLLGALAHGVGDAGDALLGGAERLREERGEPVQAALDRLGLLRQAGGDRLQRFAPLRQAGLHQLVRLGELRVDVATAIRVCVPNCGAMAAMSRST